LTGAQQFSATTMGVSDAKDFSQFCCLAAVAATMNKVVHVTMML
jgi:hypothetical protein